MKKIITPLLLSILLLINTLPIFGASLDEIDLINVNSNYVVVAQVVDQEVETFYEKNADAKMYPASMTKMLTVYTAIQNFDNPDQLITIEHSDVAGLIEVGASIAHLSVGQQYTFKELLYGAMLPSGADASNALARVVSGNMDNFVNKMNEVAQSLGMKNSSFVNATGLYDDNHYTTVNDLLKLVNAAIQDPLFYEVFSTQRYSIEPNEYHDAGLTFNSTLLDYAQNDVSRIGYIMGGKTGWIPESGYCLASFSIYKNRVVIVVTGEAYEYGSQLEDHNQFYDFLFNQQHDVTLLQTNQQLGEVELIYQNDPSRYTIVNHEPVTVQLPLLFDEHDVQHQSDFIESIETPVKENQVIGDYVISLNDEEIYSQTYRFDQAIERDDFMYYSVHISEYLQSESFFNLLWIVGPILLGLILIFIIVKTIRNRRRKRSDFKGYYFD